MITKTIFSLAVAQLPRITEGFKAVSEVHKVPHTGVDFAAPIGTKLYAAADGVVDRIVDYGATNVGKGVFIKLEDGTRLLYGHLSDISVKVGQKVQEGDLVALSGNTGRSTGPHLHLQAYDPSGKLLDPTRFAEEVFTAAPEPGFIEKLTHIGESIDNIQQALDGLIYWINPINWVKEGFGWLRDAMLSGQLDTYLLVGTIIAVWLTMVGCKNPKKYAFWGWVIYFILRGVMMI